jgi:hypothetical protein
MGKNKKTEDVEKKQPKLPGADVAVSEATRQAERYADICDDIESKKNLLQAQGEKVVQEMRRSGQKVLHFTDQNGYKHTFTLVESIVKLRHNKREDA